MEKNIGKLNDNVNQQNDHALQNQHSLGALSLKDISKLNTDHAQATNPGMDQFPPINQLLGDAGPKATNQCVGEGGAKPNAAGEQNKNVTKFNPGLAPWKVEPNIERQ